MPTRILKPEEATQIQEALQMGRAGKATLAQLAGAHDLAEDGGLNHCLGELRTLIRDATPEPPFRSEGKDILLGVGAGIITHYLLKRVEPR